MYLVTDDLPKDCFECKFRTKCEVWEKFLNLPFDKGEILMNDLDLLKPRVFTCCKIHPTTKLVSRFYFKWVLKRCRHICLFCRYKRHCEIYLNGRDKYC